MPPWFTVMVPVPAPAVMPGPDQLYVTGDAAVETITLTLVVLQVSVPDADDDTAGGDALCETVVVEKLVQPFAGFVLVRVYVPGWLMVGLAVVPPDTMPGPLQL